MMVPTKPINNGALFESDMYYIGLVLAITSCGFIGTSFIINKLSLMRLVTNTNNLRAGSGGCGYLKDWMWWFGFLMMGIGEVLNFAAYMFAPASLVTPLGALSVLISTILASRFLGEHLNNSGKAGCLLCIIGATIFVIHAPKEEEVVSLDYFSTVLENPVFTYYLLFIIIFTLIIIFYVGPKYGTRYVWVYVSLCSVIGSVTVVACKALGVAIKDITHGDAAAMWTITFLVISIVLCIVFQMNYLNRALDLFSASVVTPVYYVMFTTLVIIASASLLDEWKHMTINGVVGTTVGFFITSFAVYLLNVTKNNSLVRSTLKSSQCLLIHSPRASIGV